jgi:hypothetical protein
MLAIVTVLSVVIGVPLLVATFVAWLARASERAYRTPPRPDRRTVWDEEHPADLGEYQRLCEEGPRHQLPSPT